MIKSKAAVKNNQNSSIAYKYFPISTFPMKDVVAATSSNLSFRKRKILFEVTGSSADKSVLTLSDRAGQSAGVNIGAASVDSLVA